MVPEVCEEPLSDSPCKRSLNHIRQQCDMWNRVPRRWSFALKRSFLRSPFIVLLDFVVLTLAWIGGQITRYPTVDTEYGRCWC